MKQQPLGKIKHLEQHPVYETCLEQHLWYNENKYETCLEQHLRYNKNKFIMQNYLQIIKNTNIHDIEISISQNKQNKDKQNKKK